MTTQNDTNDAVAPLTQRVSLETLHLLQDRFAALGQVSVCICALDGERITEPTWGSPYSAQIGSSPLGRLAFDDAMRALARSPDARVPSICHDGLTMYAARVTHDADHIAMIVVGTRPAQRPSQEEAFAVADKYRIDPTRLAASVERINPHTGATPEATHQFADTMARVIATLYAQADRIERQLTDLSVVHELSNLLAHQHDLQEILDLTVIEVVQAVPVKAAGIRLLNHETGELEIRAVHNLSEQYLAKGRVVLRDNPIDAAAFEGKTVYIEDVPNDPRIRYPVNAQREGIVSGLCVPMSYRGETVGVLRVYTASRYHFSESQTSLLRSLASQAASAVINNRLLSDQAYLENTRRQVKAAAEIQRRMIPAEAPNLAGISFGCVYEPTLAVGGDFYDFLELSGGRVGVVIADVVGKGLPAALLMASIRSALRSTAHREETVSAIVAQVNRDMCRDTLPNEFVTLLLGAFSPDGRSFTYCNAGHLPPLLLRGGKFQELDTGGLVVGVDPETTFKMATVSVEPGDLIVMVTDGVTEAMNYQGECYGNDRLAESIQRHSALDARAAAQQILWDVRRFAGLAAQSDDITVVVIQANARNAPR